MDEPDAPIVPIVPTESTSSDTATTRPDGGSTARYEMAEWGAPLVPEL